MPIRPNPQRQRETRPLSGEVPWPFICLASGEKCGKTYTAVEASALPYLGRTFVIVWGESAIEEYGKIPGQRAEVVPHDGTYRDMLDAILWAKDQPRVDGKPNLIIFDSGSVLWDFLQDEQQIKAYKRELAKAQRYNKPKPDADADRSISTDQWNAAKRRWKNITDALRDHDGPAIITARLEEQVVMDGDGKPTKDRLWKVISHKSLPFDVDVMFQARTYRQWEITAMKGVGFRLDEGQTIAMPELTLGQFFEKRGLAEPGAGTSRGAVVLNPEAILDEPVVPDASAFLAEVESLNANDVDGLTAIGKRFGRAALEECEVVIRGEKTTAAAYLGNLISRAQMGAQPPAAEQAPAEPSARPTRARKAAAPAKPPAEKKQADQAVADAQAAQDAPEDVTRVRLIDEATQHAKVLGVQVKKYVEPLLKHAQVPTGAQVPIGTLMGWVISQRPSVIKALRDEGRATEAAALERAGMNVVQWSRDVDAVATREQEPANA